MFKQKGAQKKVRKKVEIDGKRFHLDGLMFFFGKLKDTGEQTRTRFMTIDRRNKVVHNQFLGKSKRKPNLITNTPICLL